MAVNVVVHICTHLKNNPAASRRAVQIVDDYYSNGGLDALGPHCDLKAREVVKFDSFMELLTNLNKYARESSYHIIVCHGNPTDGMLIPIKPGGATNTGVRIKDLAELTEMKKPHPAASAMGRPLYDVKINDVRKDWNLTASEMDGMLREFKKVRENKLVYLIRGCRMGESKALMEKFRLAFNAPRFFAPACKNGFVRVTPGVVKPTSVTVAAGAPSTVRSRTRRFPDQPNPDLVIRIDDGGPGRLDGRIYLSSSPQNRNIMSDTAKALNKTARGNRDFVTSVMFSAKTRDFYCIGDPAYTREIALAITKQPL